MATTTPHPPSSPEDPIPFPQNKASGQALLRRFGFTGLKIDAIEEPRVVDGETQVRIYALTAPILQGDGQMRRKAKTVVLRFLKDDVVASDENGWQVG
jgi:hypothetical protein